MTAGAGRYEVSSTEPKPKVTVIIPAYNAEKFVLDAIGSIVAQRFPGIEILLVDDGSRDGTVGLVQREAPQVRIIRQSNAGAAAARNTGLHNARGEYICFLDADDGWLEGKLAAQAGYLDTHPEVGAVFHSWLVLSPDASGAYVLPKAVSSSDASATDAANSGWIYPQLLLDCIVHTSTVMIRRHIVEEVGDFDTTLKTGEDYDYWLRVSRRCEIHKLAGTYSFYRTVAGSLTSAPHAENNEYRVLTRALRQWGLESPDGTRVPARRVRRRQAKMSFEFGYAHYHRGSLRAAAHGFARAVRHDPLQWRAAAYFFAAVLRRARGRA